MLPFSKLLRYGNTVNPYQLKYNFDTSVSSGTTEVHSSGGVSTAIPVPYTGYTNMLRITNSTASLIPAPVEPINLRDFEMTFIFYTYTGGSSYDVIMHFGNTNGSGIQSGLWVQIGDAGLGNRLQFGVGVVGQSTEYSCNINRSQIEGKVTKLTVIRSNGFVKALVNDVAVLIGAGNNASTQTQIANSSQVNNLYPFFGEYIGGAQWQLDAGLIDFSLKILEK